ncbi:hypothetical protein OTU49_010791 [Cherax quadricarinatus]
MNDHQEQQSEEEGEEMEMTQLGVSRSFKHPLRCKWTMWFFKIEPNLPWEDCQKEVTSFNTVEDFWSLYNHIEPPSRLKPGRDYSLFKEGIKPMWEDERNCKGGRWLVTINKQQRSTELEILWLEILMLMIGENFEDHNEEICGAVVNIRNKGDKIGVWTANSKNKCGILKIG